MFHYTDSITLKHVMALGTHLHNHSVKATQLHLSAYSYLDILLVGLGQGYYKQVSANAQCLPVPL